MWTPVKLKPDPKARGWKPRAGWYCYDTVSRTSDLRACFSGKQSAQKACDRRNQEDDRKSNDEECGEVDTTNWYGLMRGPFLHPQLAKFAGAILENDSHGFVGGVFYDTQKDLEKAWKRICDVVSEAEGEGEVD